jgi:hypothetical protein
MSSMSDEQLTCVWCEHHVDCVRADPKSEWYWVHPRTGRSECDLQDDPGHTYYAKPNETW